MLTPREPAAGWEFKKIDLHLAVMLTEYAPDAPFHVRRGLARLGSMLGAASAVSAQSPVEVSGLAYVDAVGAAGCQLDQVDAWVAWARWKLA